MVFKRLVQAVYLFKNSLTILVYDAIKKFGVFFNKYSHPHIFSYFIVERPYNAIMDKQPIKLVKSDRQHKINKYSKEIDKLQESKRNFSGLTMKIGWKVRMVRVLYGFNFPGDYCQASVKEVLLNYHMGAGTRYKALNLCKA